MLLKHEALLDLDGDVTGKRVCFSWCEDADFVMLDIDVWLDMGRPKQITVTIEPGDRLNDG